MNVLRGRPESRTAGKTEGQNARKEELADDATVKITTRLTNAQHRDMKIAAARNRISVEDAYREAVENYLKTR
jgi:predicted HicB family RNase H-like nuclease